MPPSLAEWIRGRGHSAAHVGGLGLLAATDQQIFEAARLASAVIVTKDHDFALIQHRQGPPPRVVLITIGNCTNSELRVALGRSWADVIGALDAGEALVEVGRR